MAILSDCLKFINGISLILIYVWAKCYQMIHDVAIDVTLNTI